MHVVDNMRIWVSFFSYSIASSPWTIWTISISQCQGLGWVGFDYYYYCSFCCCYPIWDINIANNRKPKNERKKKSQNKISMEYWTLCYAEIFVPNKNTWINDFEMKKKQTPSLRDGFITENEIEKFTDFVRIAHVLKFFRRTLFI